MFFSQEELYFLNQVYDTEMDKINLLDYLRSIEDQNDSGFLNNLINKISNINNYDFPKLILMQLNNLQVDLDEN